MNCTFLPFWKLKLLKWDLLAVEDPYFDVFWIHEHVKVLFLQWNSELTFSVYCQKIVVHSARCYRILENTWRYCRCTSHLCKLFYTFRSAVRKSINTLQTIYFTKWGNHWLFFFFFKWWVLKFTLWWQNQVLFSFFIFPVTFESIGH